MKTYLGSHEVIALSLLEYLIFSYFLRVNFISVTLDHSLLKIMNFLVIYFCVGKTSSINASNFNKEKYILKKRHKRVNESFDVFFSIVFIYNFESDVWLNIINNAKMKLPVLERIANKCTDRSPFKHFPFSLPSQRYQ